MLVESNMYRTGKSPNVEWVNQRTKWHFSIAILVYQKVEIPILLGKGKDSNILTRAGLYNLNQ